MSTLLIGSRPELIDLALKHQLACRKNSIVMFFTQGLRTDLQQQKLWEVGRKRTDDGSWVKVGKTLTDAPPGESPHNCGCAYDSAIIIGGKVVWDNYDLWHDVGRLGKALGLWWGGDFPSLDFCHFELSHWKKYKTQGVS